MKAMNATVFQGVNDLRIEQSLAQRLVIERAGLNAMRAAFPPKKISDPGE